MGLKTAIQNHPKVLVVEDDLCMKRILTLLLHNINPEIEIKWMPSADEAWAELQTNSIVMPSPYNLFISDISTPGIKSGLDFWKTCQTRYPHVPFLFTSGMPVETFFETFGNSIVCPPFLSKPFAVGECRQIMKILLETGNTKPNEGALRAAKLSAAQRESAERTNKCK
ncbi:MAG: response regulator [Bdellovibrionia bacterium]